MKYLILQTILSASALRLTDDPLPFGDYFHANYNGFPGTEGYAPEYSRDIPDYFTNKHLDDQFMNSMLTKYSKE